MASPARADTTGRIWLSGHEPDLRAISSRQIECLYWVQMGKSATDIGAILGISSRTVEGHIAKTCEILGVRTRIQAVVLARDLGLLTRDTRKAT